MSTVVLVGSLDTKGAEYRYARDRLRGLGVTTLVVDTGVLGSPAFTPEVSAAEVAVAAGTTLGELQAAGDRARALAAMARGAAAVLGRLRAAGQLDGVFALGGSGNTTVAATAFRALPLGVPKLILSTMTAGNIRPFVAASDLVMAASVVDMAGLNRISRTVIANSAAAIAGMATAPAPAGPTDRPLIAASMIGLTTRAVTAARQWLEELGYEVLVFHSTGTGGAAMESLIDQGMVTGVLDLTTSELADELGGGICGAGPQRATTAARRGIPQVVAPGGLDMINFGHPDTVPERYAGRRQHSHNSEVTLVRTSVSESAKLGQRLTERVSAPPGGDGGPGAGGCSASGRGTGDLRPVILLPAAGLSAIDTVGHPFHDPAADTALATAIRASADPARVRVVEVEGNIDCPGFGELAAALLHDLITARGARPSRPGDTLCTP